MSRLKSYWLHVLVPFLITLGLLYGVYAAAIMFGIEGAVVSILTLVLLANSLIWWWETP